MPGPQSPRAVRSAPRSAQLTPCSTGQALLMRPAGRLDITPSAMQRADSVSSTMSQFAAGRARAQAARVAIIDIDIHHGNGTQSIFYHRPDVFFVSVHRD